MSEIARIHQCAGWGYQLYLNPIQVKALSEEIRALQPPVHAQCDMGVGCEEVGVCYAEANGKPERCPARGCTQTDGRGCSYAQCPNKTTLIQDGGGA